MYKSDGLNPKKRNFDMFLNNYSYNNIYGYGIKPSLNNNGIITNLAVSIDDKMEDDLKKLTNDNIISIDELRDIDNLLDTKYDIDENHYHDFHNFIMDKYNEYPELENLSLKDLSLKDIKQMDLKPKMKRELNDYVISYNKHLVKKYKEAYENKIRNDDNVYRTQRLNTINEVNDDIDDDTDSESDVSEDSNQQIISNNLSNNDDMQINEEERINAHIQFVQSKINSIISDIIKTNSQSLKKDKSLSPVININHLLKRYPNLNHDIEIINRYYTDKFIVLPSEITLNRNGNSFSFDINQILKESDSEPQYDISIPVHKQLSKLQDLKRNEMPNLIQDYNNLIEEAEAENDNNIVEANEMLNNVSLFGSLYGKLNDISNMPQAMDKGSGFNNDKFEHFMVEPNQIEKTIEAVDPELYNKLEKMKQEGYTIKYNGVLTSDKKSIGGLGDAYAPVDGKIEIVRIKGNNEEVVEKIVTEFKYYYNYDVPSKGNLTFEKMYNFIDTDFNIYKMENIVNMEKHKEDVKILDDSISEMKDKIEYNETINKKTNHLIIELDNMEKMRKTLMNRFYEAKRFIKTHVNEDIEEHFYSSSYTSMVPMKFSKTGVPKIEKMSKPKYTMNTKQDYNYLNKFLNAKQKQMLFDKDSGKLTKIVKMDKTNTEINKYDVLGNSKYYMIIALKDSVIALNYSDAIKNNKLVKYENKKSNDVGIDILQTNKLFKSAYDVKKSEHLGLKLWDFKPVFMNQSLKQYLGTKIKQPVPRLISSSNPQTNQQNKKKNHLSLSMIKK